MPADPKPKPRQPYTQRRLPGFWFACGTLGNASYERLRAQAMVLLLRFYGLRVSNVATLRKDRIKGDSIFLHGTMSMLFSQRIESTYGNHIRTSPEVF